MDKFKKINTELPGVSLIHPVIFRDSRGFFLECYNKNEFVNIGIISDFVQDNHSCSAKGVIRGLHFQTTYPQEKLVRVIRGAIYDVSVDMRRNSATYGRSFGVTLSDRDLVMVHIPVGFAHGFLSLEGNTHVHYKTSEFYYPEYDSGILWNDPDLGIDWPLDKHGIKDPTISEKDSQLPRLRDIESPFTLEGAER